MDINSKNLPKCPVCESYLQKLETCAFLKCNFSYEGRKNEKNEIKPIYKKYGTKDNENPQYIETGNKGENKGKFIELFISAW